MMAMLRVPITALASHTVTRSRGRLAYGSLRRYLTGHRSVEIDLSEERPLSLSFLDELVLRLSEVNQLRWVTFVVANQDVLDKLSRISEIRKVAINYSGVDTASGKKVPRLPAPYTEVVST